MNTVRIISDDFKIINFPDGQIHVESKEYLRSYLDAADIVKLDFRPSHASDFITLIQMVDIIRHNSNSNFRFVLYMPYFMSARCDRRFTDNDSLSIKIYADIINSLNFDEVNIANPHSIVSNALIKNIRIIDTSDYRQDSFFDSTMNGRIKHILAPDEGASKKISDIYKKLHEVNQPRNMFPYLGNLLECKKKRNEKGDIVSVSLPSEIGPDLEGDIFIFDDICDGGRTFIEIAEACRKTGWKGGIYLYVDHGIFSKGIEPLIKHFSKIYTTSSINPKFWDPAKYTQFVKVYDI